MRRGPDREPWRVQPRPARRLQPNAAGLHGGAGPRRLHRSAAGPVAPPLPPAGRARPRSRLREYEAPSARSTTPRAFRASRSSTAGWGGHRLATRGRSRARARPRVLRAPREPPLPGDRLAPGGARVRLHRGARRLPRLLRPRAHALRPGVRRLHGSLREGGLKAEGLGSLKWLARLYWYTVEFGVVRTSGGLRSYGAGILSSPSEIDYAVNSPKPRRVTFDLKRVMRSLYRIDAFQETYFVIEGFDRLFEATRPDFAPLYRELAGRPRGPARGTRSCRRTGLSRLVARAGLVPPGGRSGARPVLPSRFGRRPSGPGGIRMLATLALAALVAPQAPAVPAKAVTVRPSRFGPQRTPRRPVQAWAKELRTALDQRKDEFRRAKPGEGAAWSSSSADATPVAPGIGWRAGAERRPRDG